MPLAKLWRLFVEIKAQFINCYGVAEVDHDIWIFLRALIMLWFIDI